MLLLVDGNKNNLIAYVPLSEALVERRGLEKMENIANKTAEFELYSDLIKIGLPAALTLFAGLIAGLLPYLLEKRKLREAIKQEARAFYRAQSIELIECISYFSGRLFHYINIQLGCNKISGLSEEQESQLVVSEQQVSEAEEKLKKARAIAGMLGKQIILDKIDEFDSQTTITFNSLAGATSDESKEYLRLLRNKEKEMMSSLNSLIDEK